MITRILVSVLCFLACIQLRAQTILPNFTIPDTVCVNSPVTITNTSVGGTNFYWSFCSASLNTSTPTAENIGNPGGNLSLPVFMDFVYANNKYYGFVTNHIPGGLVRLDFGNSLLNSPTPVYLGDFGGIIPTANGSEGIQVVENEGRWYAIIVGGNITQGTNPRILKIDFGADLENPAPVATNWGNLGNMAQPIDLHIFKENNNWYGFTVNSENNTITRFNFTNSFSNTPTAVNLGNIGGIAYPTGIYAINDNGFWRVFITNCGNNTNVNAVASITRLDFGNSLLNTPTGINIGNPGNSLHQPRDITLMRTCGEVVGFAVNGKPGTDDLVRLDFKNNLTSSPVASSLGNIGSFNFPHSLSKLFRVNENIYSFVTNVNNNTISRIQFSGCNNSNIPSFSGKNPPSITYNAPGTYSINLTIDDGLPGQASICKQIVVVPTADFSFEQNICDPLSVKFIAAGTAGLTTSWNFGDGNTITNQRETVHRFASFGQFDVQLTKNNSCSVKKNIDFRILRSDIIITPDTIVCEGTSTRLQSKVTGKFCWSPISFLDNPTLPNPTTSTKQNIKYILTADSLGKNLVTNGDFALGNNSFQSEYLSTSQNYGEGQIMISANPKQWNSNFSQCQDHTTGTGQMLLVNGAVTGNPLIWKQTIQIEKNKNYEFGAWLQSLSTTNLAEIVLLINGQEIGNRQTVSSTNCQWNRITTTWNSDTATQVTLAILNRTTIAAGNDFAIDDIYFAPKTINRDSVNITVTNAKLTATADTTICFKSPVQLAVTGATAYTWTPATGLNNASISNPVAIPTSSTKYIVSGITTNGCVGKDTVVITVNSLPGITLMNDTTVCLNSTIQLRASGGVKYSWLPVTGLSNSSIPNPTLNVTQAQTHKVFVTDGNGCTNEDSVSLGVRPYPAFTASGVQSICEGTSVSLKAQGGDSYNWSPSLGLNNANSAEPTASPSISTDYRVSIKESTCLNDTTITVRVNVHSNPVLEIDKSNDIDCDSPTAILTANGGIQYQWQPALPLNDAVSATPTVSIDSTTTFHLTAWNQHGCSSTSSVTVFAEKVGGANYSMPNAFTPNNDGKNDCFGIRNWGTARIQQFSIYNRWGQLVFQTNDPNRCWDGTFKGLKQQAGGYVYVIQASTFCGPIKKRGVVTLVR